MNFNKKLVTKTLGAASVSLALFSSALLLADNPNKVVLDNKDDGYQLPQLAGPELQPTKKFRNTGQLVAWLLMQSHYQHPNFDNALSRESFKQLVKMFDPNRSYFLASDVEKFKVFESKFDDAIRTGQIELAYEFFELFEKRHRERYEYALKIANQPFDFTADEEFQYDRRESPWFENRAELDEYWRKKVKYDALNLKLADQSEEKIAEKLTRRYKTSVRRLSQTTDEDVFGFFMNAINASIDPHTTYYTPRQFEDFNINMSLKLQGIGAVLTQEDEFTKVVRIVNKGPAYKSGQIHKDDKIIGVGQGDEGEMVDVIGWRNGDVVDLIRGEAGSVVRLQVIPHTAAGDGKSKVVRIVREEIKLEDQAAKSDVLEIEQDGKKIKYGVIELPSFYAESPNRDNKNKELTSTTHDVKRLIGKLQKQGVEGLIIDLRNNGGGSLSEAVDMTGLFIDKGPVVQGKDYDGNVRVLRDNDGKTFYQGPLAVLVNAGSASASEIFAGAIQDYGRGIVIGENTFGKGTVQGIRELSRFMRNPEGNLGALKLTVEKFYRVTGDSTQKRGVKPDISFPSFYDLDDHGEASYDNALAWDTIDTTKFDKNAGIESFIPYLQQAHAMRFAKDKQFSLLVKDIEEVKAEKDKKSISLNYKQRLADRLTNDEKRLERANLRRQEEGKLPFKTIEELETYAENKENQPLDNDRIDFEGDLLLFETANILGDFIKAKSNPELVTLAAPAKAAIN
ncbi:carboxy terminal-processing peptidase [Kangiella sp. TOML190]|uniref:carboxy terminal-processing peptidase n=1 Tax=Kangiella sp. TOML190 TaxID=2931351 RepID=UPI002041CB22|nr:carboxy terminal-processing peptidase [Kangiella sp. TOML190]